LTETNAQQPAADGPPDLPFARPPLPWGVTVAALAGLAGGWIAAGSTGLLGHPLRHALTWLAVGTAICADRTGRSWAQRAILLLAVVAAALMTMSQLAAVNVLAVAAVLAALAAGRHDAGWRAMGAAALAVTVLAVYRLALVAGGSVWIAADRFGGLIGRAAGVLTARPLWVGATFAGLDFLVAMTVLYAGWLVFAPGRRGRRAAWGAAGILVAHGLYLVGLTYADALAAAPPDPHGPADWSWKAAAATLVPWNLPALAGLLHLLVAGAMLRWTSWPPEPAVDAAYDDARSSPLRCFRRGPTAWAATLAAAAILPIAAILPTGRCSLEGKRVVVYEKGYLNWLKPTHGDYGRLSIGMYGMMEQYVESLGGQFARSAELSQEDLDSADVLILIYPDDPWEASRPGQPGQLERIEQFVRRGGSLLVLGEHTVWEDGPGGARFNDVLEPTGMRVRFDSATFEVGGWLHSYEALSHPATAGLRDGRNEFGVVIGASVAARPPAVPLLVGRWGWADPGDMGGNSKMGNDRYDAGEKLGDIVLAAEQRLGAGTIVAFGDTSSMTNGITIGSHVFTSRLLGYLAARPGTGQDAVRQAATVLLAVTLVGLLALGCRPARIAAAVAVLGASLTICTAVSHELGKVLPDGRRSKPNKLAYIDSTHMEAASEEAWRPDGTMGLEMTLIRSGYLVLSLPEFTPERLRRAGLVVSIAPAREYTKAERQAVRDFVEEGGIFICTVGWDRRRASRSLLADFGLAVGLDPPGSPGPPKEPQPLGHYKAPYMARGSRQAYVRFNAAWPVACADPGAQPIAYGRMDGRDVPVICLRRVGQKGKFVLVGDTGFAMNKNLERRDGLPIEGLRENADFWRWLLTVLRDEPQWLPPAVQPPATRPATQPAGGAAAGGAS